MIAERAREAGATHHRFYGRVDGDELLVVDEWPDPESFHAFFANSPEIADMMRESGATGEPQIVFWRALDTPDRF